MACECWIQNHAGNLPRWIDEVIAVTNFVKFSTSRDASSSSIPDTWWRECATLYVKHEIRVLCPDIIIGFGKRTARELARLLEVEELHQSPCELLDCRFPARIPSVRARPLSGKESNLWESSILPLLTRMKEPGRNSYHRWKVEQYAGYFIDVLASWKDPW